MDLNNPNQDRDLLPLQANANSTASVHEGEIDADFDVEDDLEKQLPNQIQHDFNYSVVDKSITNNKNDTATQNPAHYFAGKNEAGYQPIAAPENEQEDSNMVDHLPPLENQAIIKAEKANKEADRLRQEIESFKQLSLDEKLALLKKYNAVDFYKQDHFIDACDTTDAFCLAKIMQINGSNIQVNFDGWSSKWDLWYRVKCQKVAPFRTQHTGYSGQVKTAIRNHMEFNLPEMRLYRKQIETMIANDLEGKLAHETTQYLRGQLYTYADFLLGQTFDNDVLPEVIEFQKAILRLIVTYLKKIGSMQKTIYELSQNRELFLVDPQCAILSSYPELSDMLKRLFACCQRALRFYLFNDIDQIQPEDIALEVQKSNDQIVPNTFGVVVQDFTSADFKGRRILDEIKYIPDAARNRIVLKDNLVFGQMINFVQYFADIGGFNAILNVIKLGIYHQSEHLKIGKEEADQNQKPADYSQQKVDLNMISYLILPLRNLGSVLTKNFKESLCMTIKELIVDRLMKMSEKDLKDVDKDAIFNLIVNLKQYLLLSHSEQETAQIIETTQLYLSLRFLKCGNLEKRLKGLNDIRIMIERVVQYTNKKNQGIRRTRSAMQEEEQSKVKPSEFLTIENLREWISENQVLQIILGGNAHIEIVKRCGPILKFMSEYGQGRFDASTVSLVWKCQMGKHEEMVRTIYNLIQEVMPSLNMHLVDLFYEKIQEMPTQMYDEKFLVFLREYTKMALQKRYKINQREHAEERLKKMQQDMCEDEIEMNEDQNEQEVFDAWLSKQENKKLNTLTMENLDSLANQEVQNLYGLPIFWSICQDSGLNVFNFSSDKKNIELLRQISLNSMLEMFDQLFRKQIRLTYLLKSIHNIMENYSLVQSLHVARTIIKSFYIDQMHQIRDQQNYKDWEENQAREESKQYVESHIILFFQNKLRLMDALIQNLELYNVQVKHNMKIFVEKNRVPENIENHIFVGQYSHSNTLVAILEFVEYIVTQSQNESLRSNELVTIGIENIQKLWRLFVSEPNFNSDQNLFLNLINKQSFQSNLGAANSQNKNFDNQLYANEQNIFTEAEKKFLFLNILCNPAEVNINKVTLNLVKVFQKYFKSINSAEGNISIFKKKIKVLKFDKLFGMESLWKIALHSQIEKVKSFVHELLVDLHLKFDHQNDTLGHKVSVISRFIEECMQELESEDNSENPQSGKKGAIQLISLFLDRYEGKKPILPEASIAQRLNSIKPQTITVFNCVDMNTKIQRQIQVSFFQTLGYVRSQIAELFGLQINQFIMVIRSSQIDAETDDDTYINDIQGIFNQVTIKLNKNYDPHLHPKFLISNNEHHFKTIFSMLRGNQASAGLTELVWELISKLPQNATVCEQFEHLQIIKVAKSLGSPADIRAAWSHLLDEKAIFNLLYCLKMINSTYMSPQSQIKQKDDDENEEASAEAKSIIIERLKTWKIQFIVHGGFNHLLFVLANLNLDEIHCLLELVCVKTLLEILFRFVLTNSTQKLIGSKGLLESQDPELLKLVVLKIIKLVDLICKFSIQEEKARGESFEAIEKKIEAAKLRKHRQKLLIQGNKADAVKKQEGDEDDESNDDKKLLQSLNQNFQYQVDIVIYLFNFMNQITNKLPELTIMITQYSELQHMFVRGMLLTENQILRRMVCSKFSEIIKNASNKPDCPQELIAHLLQLQIKAVLPLTQKNESRSLNFYEVLQDLISQLNLNYMIGLKQESIQLIESLADQIIKREIKEKTTSDRDIYLWGQMQVLTRLLQKFPDYKQNIGGKLTSYLIHQCLFEIPYGNKGENSAPKCKSHESRKAAFNLLATLSRDCLENLNIVLDYMHKFSNEVSWRTKKENDWNIKFFDDEKSSTGHVGIKNLGCICYMNSLNQQLFMIPGFRNDILSIKDPNHDKNADEDNMFLQWQTLFAGLLLSEKMYVNPKSYCHSFKDWEGQPINIIEQMDVEEYLNMFMDRLETAIKGTPEAQTIQYHFGGTFANEIICKTCPHSYVRTEKFLNVGIPVMNKKNLYEGLDTFVKGDMLEEQNQYQCEKCDKKVDALKRTCLQKLPRYMIMTLKRFEFDLDRMVRVKLNEFYEFKEEIDVSEYTQEYLNAKERAQKVQKSDDEDEIKLDSKGEILKTLKQPREYYQYELVGIVVHSGTADSGHYYSYIKEQEAFKNEGKSNKWYEFNDIWVRDFDPHEIPSECYGGEETAFQQNILGSNTNQQKFFKFRNAYLLVYKRKLTDESLIIGEETEAESSEILKREKSVGLKYQLGSEELKLDISSPLYKKIAADNHKYWQNRFLFGQEYFEFVQQIILYWNTNRIIPSEVSWRNNDYHLQNLIFQQLFETAKKPIVFLPLNDVKIDMSKKYTSQEIQRAKLQVFKFATQFYVSILQRSFDKNTLPDTSKYIRTYINDDETCARWLISEFVNFEVLNECFLENTMPFMRQILAGLLYCAMLKVWETDKKRINHYWEDLKANVPQPRYTILGNFILCLLHKLPQVLDYSNNQSQWFQMLARFSNLGPEARLFLLNAKAIERCMNFFHIKDTPYAKEFLEQQILPFNLKTLNQLDMGMPTPDDSNQKMSAFSILKERERQKKLHSDNPKFVYLIETVSNCLRALHVETPCKVKEGIKTSSFQLEDSGIPLSEKETTLIMPIPDFIEKFVYSASKPRSMSALAKGYIHWCYYNPKSLNIMWETVCLGLKKHDFKKIKPFLILFQHMLEAKDSPAVKQMMGQWLGDLVQHVIPENLNYYQWMETIIDFIIKIGFRIPECSTWFVANYDQWSYLTEWLKENPEPPQQTSNYYAGSQYQGQNVMRLNKHKYTKPISNRYDKIKNQTLLFFRKTHLMYLKNSNNQFVPDLSQEIDLELLDFTDYKYTRESQIEYTNDLYPNNLSLWVVLQELEELLSLKSLNSDQQNWEAQEKNKMYPVGIIGSTYRNRELKKIFEAFQNKQAQDRVKIQQQQMIVANSGNLVQGSTCRNVANQQSSETGVSITGQNSVGVKWKNQNEGHIDDVDLDDKPIVQQDADMEFDGQNNCEYSNNFENLDAVDPQYNSSGGRYSQDNQQNGSDDEMIP